MTDERVAATVVIPTLGRADMLRIGLAALSDQSLASDAYEVIVSVDGPGEEFVSLVEGHPASLSVPHHRSDASRQGFRMQRRNRDRRG
jgi:glycosyltransferase involved in cell wall biosynthesis